MAYQVIARKWRPRDFTELVGQEHVSQTLLNALRHQRLHHALLFTGPRGTGKTSSARILAKALRCPNAVDFVPCHVCPECEEIASGRSLNVIEIDGASNNGVDAIRELRDTVGYMPSTGKRKLYIIDEVHMLSTSAFNALLKTLEEPPEHVIFVLATTEAHKIPETVLSRVQRYDFRCIPTRTIVAHLKNICEAEKISAEPEALWTIARQGAGSMRDSQSFLDQAITFAGTDLTLAKVTSVLGLTDRNLLAEILSALIRQDSQAAINVLERVFTAGYEARLFVQDLLEQIRHLLMIKVMEGKPGSVVDLPDSEIQALHKLGDEVSSEDIHSLFDMALKGASDLQRAPDTRIALEMVILRMSTAPRWARMSELMTTMASAPAALPMIPSRPAAAAQKTIAHATPTAAAAEPAAPRRESSPEPMQDAEPEPILVPAPVVGAPPPSSQSANEAWFELVRRIQSVNTMIGAQLENCFLKEIQGQRIILGVAPKMKFLTEKLNAPDFKKKVLNYITTFWGPGYEIEVVSGEPSAVAMTPKAVAGQKDETQRQELRRQVEEHPLIKSTQSIFKTEIRSIKENKT